ncbi:MAG TPA: bacteriohopanetetrol glucosamine biosynthesis glycosyltransferase HpnI [Candidatus Acidoferrales bacterium]|nr:bacteriohopanetetrol glucosamine biosynthesis glycosyltransferase HpnI [Candidatus Acidoferrales bacterium]
MRRRLFGMALSIAAIGGVGYLGFALARVREFNRRERVQARTLPPVSILKPLHGEEEGLFDNLASFCEQNYPVFEVLLGVHDAHDPALRTAQQIVARYPDRARLVIGDGKSAAANPKVANLSGMIGIARNRIIVMADADMRVGATYLRHLVAPFEDEDVGAVTCLYAGSPSSNLPSQLGAMFINEQFAPSVLVATALEPLRYCFGATIAVRRSVLDAIGGFAALADHVADDHLLGKLVTDRGRRVVLSSYVVENVIDEAGFAGLWARELRWSRTIRSVRPLGHACSFLTFGLPLAAMAAVVSRGRYGTPLLVVLAAALRAALHLEAKAGSPLLIPVRDVMSVAVWAASFVARDVDWRGRRLELDSAGEILES